MTDSASKELYESLRNWRELKGLIDDGETEGLHLECKAPHKPSLNRDLKAKLARAISGFSNTAGGVVIWGLATTKHSHSGLDVITQIEPVGSCAMFEKQVRAAFPALTTPSVLNYQVKTIKRRGTDTQGVVIAHIPSTSFDPVMNNLDNVFYFRSADNLVPAPYELIKRLYAVTDVPDVYPNFTEALVELQKDGSWKIPIIVENRATAFAENVDVSVVIENPVACEAVSAPQFQDNSSVNPGRRIFMNQISRGIHRNMPIVIGHLIVKMKTSTRAKRRLDLSITTYASRMRARNVKYSLSLAKSGFKVKVVNDKFLY